MTATSRSMPKKMMIKFIQKTVETPEFKFKLHGSEEDAKRFVHRMRVELSRMRDIVRDSGRVPKEFKVLLHNLEPDPLEGVTTITLLKTKGRTLQIADEVREIFDDIAEGEKLA